MCRYTAQQRYVCSMQEYTPNTMLEKNMLRSILGGLVIFILLVMLSVWVNKRLRCQVCQDICSDREDIVTTSTESISNVHCISWNRPDDVLGKDKSNTITQSNSIHDRILEQAKEYNLRNKDKETINVELSQTGETCQTSCSHIQPRNNRVFRIRTEETESLVISK